MEKVFLKQTVEVYFLQERSHDNHGQMWALACTQQRCFKSRKYSTQAALHLNCRKTVRTARWIYWFKALRRSFSRQVFGNWKISVAATITNATLRKDLLIRGTGFVSANNLAGRVGQAGA